METTINEGAVLFLRDQGLALPNIRRALIKLAGKVVEETADYFASEDNMGAFVDYCCDTGDESEFMCRAKEIYDMFFAWWKQYVGNFPPKQRKLGTYLKERFRSEKVGGVYWYYGIHPNPEIIEEIMPDRKV